MVVRDSDVQEKLNLTRKILSWSGAHNIKTSSGIPFEWHEHKFMIEPFTDFHPDQAINKCAQVGFSETEIVKTWFMAREMELSIGYSLQSATAMDDFNRSKFDAIIGANPYLNSFTTGNSQLKEIITRKGNKAFIHLVGAYNTASEAKKEQTAKGATFTADVLIHDEASRSDQYILNQLKSRISNSKFRYRWLFDNPLYPGLGADSIYKISDQRHWIVTCEKCRYKQYLDWFKLSEHTFVQGTNHCYVDDENQKFICGKCGKELTDESRRSGEWVAKRPKIVDYRGYWINQMCYIRHSAKSMLKDEREMTPSVFANMVMGKPYIGSDVTVTRQTLMDNIQIVPHTPKKGFVAMGVDQGNEKQYVLRDFMGIFEIGRVRTWDEIRKIRDMHDAVIVMDADPQTGPPKQICEENEGKAWRAKFSPEADQRELAKFGTTNDYSLVLIRKHEMFDNMANNYNNLKSPINVHVNKLQEFIDEWQALVRVVTDDNMGNQKYEWIKIAPHVDLPFADLYSQVAMMMLPSTSTSFISPFGVNGLPPDTQGPLPTTESVIQDFTNSLD